MNNKETNLQTNKNQKSKKKKTTITTKKSQLKISNITKIIHAWKNLVFFQNTKFIINAKTKL
jgi:hypothetical protein